MTKQTKKPTKKSTKKPTRARPKKAGRKKPVVRPRRNPSDAPLYIWLAVRIDAGEVPAWWPGAGERVFALRGYENTIQGWSHWVRGTLPPREGAIPCWDPPSADSLLPAKLPTAVLTRVGMMMADWRNTYDEKTDPTWGFEMVFSDGKIVATYDLGRS